MHRDLCSILSFMEKLNELDLNHINFICKEAHSLYMFKDSLKNDSLPKNKLLVNSPNKELDMFVVPKMLI